MADLTSLLNPAPSSDPTQDADVPNKTSGSGRLSSANLPPVKIGSPNVQQPSIKSPLDTLADAATSSAPLLSPTNPANFMNLGAYAPPILHSSSRPTSSRITPPVQSHAPAPTSPTFSPGLQQYHHPTSNEIRARRASEAAEVSTDSLPPLRQSLPEQHFPETLQSVEQPLQDDPPTPILPGISATAGLLIGPSIHNQINDNTTVPSHIRQPSSETFAVAQTSNIPPIISEQAEVKAETTDIMLHLTSSPQLPTHPTQQPAEPKQESESSVIPMADMTSQSSPVAAPVEDINHSAMLKPPPPSGRKRPAPKKGTATAVKPASKKRKVEAVESIEKASPARGTPTSSRASKTPALKSRKRESATPRRSSSVANDDEDEDEDGVFCICRGPDNHTWMIACDGSCDDWFHGKCINMTEKEGDLIEKPQLHRSRQSDEHGCEFMRREALKKEEEARTAKGAGSDNMDSIVKKGRKTNNSFADTTLINDNDVQTQALEPSPQPGTKRDEGAEGKESESRLRSGILQPAELKALVNNVKDVTEFHKLGNGLVNLPATAEPNDIKMEDTLSSHNSQIPYNPAESDLLQALTAKKDELRSRKRMLDDRDTFLVLVRERAKTVLDHLKKKENNIKDICGFDVRLIWSDEEFEIWRNSVEGVSALKDRKLGAPTVLDMPIHSDDDGHKKLAVNGDQLANGDDATASGAPNIEQQQQPDADEIGKGVCQKKRCERHKQWYKIQQQEIAFAKDEVRQEMRRLDEEENGVRDRAKIRWLEAKD
ncbi:MAG: hypothetical protein Q9172_001028 [Xanthocarpia lactea]